ncbi:MAG: PLP-dependent aminotransferase family protein [Phenylobacterium zucineum]|nr:MAG: PLP-dependent aminotransferase family protein [Phenylobacterium zucineum]
MYASDAPEASVTNRLGWLDRARAADGPIYAAIVGALAEAIRTGELQPGERLPAQRAVAATLGIDFTTVTRAYAAARERGLVEGEVGRGTFVRARAELDEAGLVDLSMNLPPPPAGLSLGALLAETTAAILRRTDPATLMAYHPGAGALGQRMAGARWLAPVLGDVPAERVLVAPGAQAALAAVLSTIARRGDTIVTDPLTYPGLLGLAATSGLRVVACPGDAGGMSPDALRAICRVGAPAAVCLTPTLQNPGAITLPPDRRHALAQVVRAAGAWLVEDDPYSRLLDAPPPAVATLAPERTFHIATLSKTLSPGLRIAYVVGPAGQPLDRVAEALRALALMPAPLMAAVATSWIREGEAEALLAGVRAEARARRAVAAELLPAAVGPPESLHVWLPLPDMAAAERLRHAAQEQGLALVTSDAFAAADDAPAGVRISLGGPGKRQVLAAALRRIAGLTGAAA